MAEAIMKLPARTRVFVDSVGVRAQEVDGFVIAVMDEIGIDVTKHRAKTLDDLEDDPSTSSSRCRRKRSTRRST